VPAAVPCPAAEVAAGAVCVVLDGAPLADVDVDVAAAAVAAACAARTALEAAAACAACCWDTAATS
jgi:hypothetical protein